MLYRKYLHHPTVKNENHVIKAAKKEILRRTISKIQIQFEITMEEPLNRWHLRTHPTL